MRLWLDHYFLWQCLWLGQGPRHLFTSRKALQSFKARLFQSFLSQVALQSCLVSFGGSFMGMGLLFYFCSFYIYDDTRGKRSKMRRKARSNPVSGGSKGKRYNAGADKMQKIPADAGMCVIFVF